MGGVMSVRYSNVSLAVLGCAQILFPVTANAQEGGKGKIEELLDSNGVDVSSETMDVSIKEEVVSIGERESGGLSLVRSYSDREISHNFNFQVSGTIVTDPSGYTVTDSYTSATLGAFRSDFEGCYSSGCVARLGDGAMLIRNTASSPESWTYTTNDGTVGVFDKLVAAVDDANSGYAVPTAWGRTLTKPNGEKITLTYFQDGGGGGTYPNRRRLTSVQSNLGYQIKFEYASDVRVSSGSSNNTREWHRVVKITAFNDAIEYCSPAALHCSFVQNWPTATFTYALTNASPDLYSYANAAYTTTDASGVQRKYTYLAQRWPDGYREHGLQNYARGNPEQTVIAVSANGVEKNITTIAGTIAYQTDALFAGYAKEWDEVTAVRTDPSGGSRSTRSVIYDGKPREIVDEDGRSWKFQYDSEHRLKYSIPPEGTVSGTSPPTAGFTEYTYDTRGNVTQTKVVPKAGSGLANIITTAGFPTTCTYPKTCNRPIWVKDAKGNQTDYTYNNSHGGVVSEMRPAPTAGAARPLTLTAYAQRYAWIKNASNVLVQSPDPIWMVTTVTECQTAVGSSSPVCDSSALQTVTTYQYGASGTRESLLVKGIAVTSSGTTLRTCYGYDIYNRKISETKPKANLGVCP